jgi:hypothetical protein
MATQTELSETVLAQYADGPARLESALVGLTESDLNLSLAVASWTIRQIVHHLVDGDDIWKIFIKAALGNSDALFSLQWYTAKPQMEWSESWAYACRDLDSSMALFSANRRHIVDLLEHIPGACEKSIRFQRLENPEIRITIFDVLELHVRHLADHIKDIQAIRLAYHIEETMPTEENDENVNE